MRPRCTASARQVSQALAARSRPAWDAVRGCFLPSLARRARRGSGASVRRADCCKVQRATRGQRSVKVRSQRQGDDEGEKPAHMHSEDTIEHPPTRCEIETAASLRCGLRSGALQWTLGADGAHDLVESRRLGPGRVPDLHLADLACPLNTQDALGDLLREACTMSP